ncbi:hypothetical protein B484DRAFT_159003 [Ochromonadaceae sp. CCMP2298]|nr:hypothetical protein B484DRAFT_159003 [Ochromonadaceae sp. CCMP2298]
MRLVYLSLLVYRAASLRLLPQSASSTSTLAALNSSNRKLSSPSTPTLSAHNTKLMSSFSTAIDTNGDTDTASNGPNPLLADWSQHEHGLPPFLSTKAHHFEPALKAAMGEHLGELGHIAANAEAPTFENTIAAFDRAGGLFSQVALLYYNLCSSNSPPELQAVELKMSGPLAAHETTVHALPGLFHRIDAVKRGMGEGGDRGGDNIIG